MVCSCEATKCPAVFCEKAPVCKDVAEHSNPLYLQLAIGCAALGWFTSLVLYYTRPAPPVAAVWETESAAREERYLDGLRHPPARRAGPLARRAVAAHLL